jgi:hypothetical protein
MKAGAVRDERSPLKEAIDYIGASVDQVDEDARGEGAVIP